MGNNRLTNGMGNITGPQIVTVGLILFCLYAVLKPILFDSSRLEQQRSQECLSNEMKLGVAFSEYLNDNDQKYPAGTHPAPLVGIASGWAGQVYPYVKSTAVFKCPDDETRSGFFKSYNAPVSYAYNWNLGNKLDSKGIKGLMSRNPASDGDLNNPDKTVVLCEAFGTVADLSDVRGIESSSPTVVGDRYTITSSIGGDGSNVRYATGILRCDSGMSSQVGNVAGSAISAEGIHTYDLDCSHFLLADGHVRSIQAGEVSAGFSNPVSLDDCTAGQRLYPHGTAGPGYAAGSGCQGLISATFSVN